MLISLLKLEVARSSKYTFGIEVSDAYISKFSSRLFRENDRRVNL